MPKTITIIGEREVGKTTLFRQIVKKYSLNTNKKPAPTVNYTEEIINIESNNYKLIDTPQFILSPQNEIEKEIKNQLTELLAKSDLILWVTDRISESSFIINQHLKKISVPKFLILNKTDLAEGEEKFSSFQNLQSECHFFLSALKGFNLDNLIKKIISLLPSTDQELITSSSERLSLLIFGPPNSGKSTLMNYLLKENRSLATPIAGTTQEPVVSHWNWKKIDFQLVDSAGITKEQKIGKELWKKCDMAWAVVDATLPLTKQLLQIINLGEKNNQPLIIIVNKSDLTTNKKELKEELKSRLKSLSYVPILYLSALKGSGIKNLMTTLAKMVEQSQRKTGKKELEKIIEKMLLNNPPNYYQNGKLKIYFAKHKPGLIHNFIFFINNPQWAHFSYQRYITNYLRKYLKLDYLPLKVIFKKSV